MHLAAHAKPVGGETLAGLGIGDPDEVKRTWPDVCCFGQIAEMQVHSCTVQGCCAGYRLRSTIALQQAHHYFAHLGKFSNVDASEGIEPRALDSFFQASFFSVMAFSSSGS